MLTLIATPKSTTRRKSNLMPPCWNLVDMSDLDSDVRKGVQVRLLSVAPNNVVVEQVVGSAGCNPVFREGLVGSIPTDYTKFYWEG